jgi:ubiquinone/menaquinone biosynthesis C-methylase UbiE
MLRNMMIRMTNPHNHTNFDLFSSHYEEHVEDPIKNWFGGNSSQYYLKLKADELCRHLRRLHLEPKKLRALDVGCGTGVVMRMLRDEFAQLHGVDTSKGMIEEAKRYPYPQLLFYNVEGLRFPFDEGQFDIVYSMSLFHHVPPENRIEVLREMTRVLKCGGWIINFEHNALNPVTRQVVNRCPLDRGVTLLQAGEMVDLCGRLQLCDVHKRFILFFPEALRMFRRLEPYLSWLAFGGQFYVCACKVGSRRTLKLAATG